MAHNQTGWQSDILDRLARYPQAKVTSDEGFVHVTLSALEGFDVSIRRTDDEYQVDLGGWHEHFSDRQEALECFSFGLSDACRLKVTIRGQFECAWTVQSCVAGEWVDDSTTGLLFVPFWRAKRFEFRRNRLITVS